MDSNCWKDALAVVGGGRYGRLALERLSSKVAVVVEPEPGPDLDNLSIPVWRADGLEATRLMLDSDCPPSYIIPTLPRHLLAGWLRLALCDMQPAGQEITAEHLSGLDALTHFASGKVYVSLADFTCPDDCPEPAAFCTVTQKPRGPALYERLRGLNLPGMQKGVIQSFQLAPGIGGLKSSDMLDLKRKITQNPADWFIATACRCHGVAEIISFHKS